MAVPAINLRVDFDGTSTCDVSECVGLHYQNVCYTLNEGFELDMFVTEMRSKRMHVILGREPRDNAEALCQELIELKSLIDDERTPLRVIHYKRTRLVKKFGGKNPSQRRLYHEACLQLLRQRHGFKPRHRHRIPELNTAKEVLEAIANWRLEPWVKRNLDALVLRAKNAFNLPKGAIEQALSIGGGATIH